MKAKELKDRSFVTNKNYAGDQIVGKYVFTEEEMAIFWSQLCKEQRELCQHSLTEITGNSWKDILSWQKQLIKHAPEPDIE